MIRAVPKNIVQAYRLATEEIDDSDDLEQKIDAASKVIDFCAETDSCRLDDSIKKNQIMYWSYINRAKAYLDKNGGESDYEYSRKNYIRALKNYNEALAFAVSENDVRDVLRNMAALCRKLGDEESYIQLKLEEIDGLPDSEKFQEYCSLVNELSGNADKINILEKALFAVTDEDVSFITKCRNTIEVCRYLEKSYLRGGDEANAARVANLRRNAEELLSRG